MPRSVPHRPMLAPLALLLAASTAACVAESPLTPERGTAPALSAATASGAPRRRGPDLAGCEQLQAPAGSKVVAHQWAAGVQVYRWSGTAWQFVGPVATLYGDPAGRRQVGTHYAGPTWEGRDGSTVRGSAPVPCAKRADAIPWLRLVGTPGATRGLFRRVTVIQRVNTTGGLSPATPGAAAGEEARVPYTAEYYFYRVR